MSKKISKRTREQAILVLDVAASYLPTNVAVADLVVALGFGRRVSWLVREAFLALPLLKPTQYGLAIRYRAEAAGLLRDGWSPGDPVERISEDYNESTSPRTCFRSGSRNPSNPVVAVFKTAQERVLRDGILTAYQSLVKAWPDLVSAYDVLREAYAITVRAAPTLARGSDSRPLKRPERFLCHACKLSSGCSVHEIFRCVSCRKPTYWRDGGADERPNDCSECWAFWKGRQAVAAANRMR